MAKTIIKPAAAKKVNYSDKTVIELEKMAIVIKEESIVLKRNMHMGDVPNVNACKYKRRELARVLTALNAARSKGEVK